jgi:hypothetical protein
VEHTAIRMVHFLRETIPTTLRQAQPKSTFSMAISTRAYLLMVFARAMEYISMILASSIMEIGRKISNTERVLSLSQQV